jgi:hypothetical protein
MARGPFLRDELVPILDRWLSPDLDRHCFDRFQLMKARYLQEAGNPPVPAGPSEPPDARSAGSAALASGSETFADLFAELREAWPS